MWARRLRLRFRSFVRKDELDAELESELAFHLAELKNENLAIGMTEEEAEVAARRTFGRKSAIGEQCRDQRRIAWMEDFMQDVRYSLRGLRRNPAFTIVAISTLALCVGVNAAFLETAWAIAFKPLPYAAPDRLVELHGILGVGPVASVRQLARNADYAGYSVNDQITVQLGSEAVKVRASTATWNLLRVLATVPLRGHWFEPDEELPARNRVAVLSERMWRQRFNGDTGIIGRPLVINDRPYQVVGIMPAGFAFPSPDTDLWIPVNLDPRRVGDLWGGGSFMGVGRLREGVSLAGAQTEVRPIAGRVRAMFPWRMPDAWGSDATAVPLDQAITEQARPKVIALSAAAFLLLLIGCANVINLLLAQGIRRERELAMREALGAWRGRLVRQFVTESAVLITAGGLAGLAIAVVILRALPFLLPRDTPRLVEIAPNTTLLMAVGGSTLLSAVLFVLARLTGIRRWTGDSLSARAMTPSRRSSALSVALIGVELALATALTIGAGLMGRTLWQLSHVNSGLDTNGVVSARISLGHNACPTFDRCRAEMQRIEADLAGQPGVESISWANATPLTKDFSATAVSLEDHPRPPSAPAFVFWTTSVTPAYTRQLGMFLRRGRLFDDGDRKGSAPVTIVSESTARRFWPAGNALGQRIRRVADTEWRTVVGVVSDAAQYSLTGFPEWVDGAEYEPLAQSFPWTSNGAELSVFVRSARPAVLASGSPSSIPSRFPDVAVSHIESMDRTRSESVADQRSTTALLVLFAALGLLLGGIGVHGVVAQRVSQRRREIGIRIAMGASGRRVLGMVLTEIAGVAVVGLAAGVLAAMGLTRFLQALLFGVTRHDTLAFVLSPAALLIAALTGALIPGLRASRTDPALTLRED